MRLSTKQLISCALVNIAAAICVQWWPGEEISIWSKQCGTTMYHATKKLPQALTSNISFEYKSTHYFFFLFLLRHLQKSRIGNFSAFPNLTGWLASDIYWKVEWAKTKSEGSWLSRQAGWHRVRDNSRPNGELQVPCQGKTGLALKVEAARTNK